MHLDVADLRDFYATPLGQVTRSILVRRIRDRWRGGVGETVVGLGFATPYLNALRGDAERAAALMPAHQGALIWPSVGKVVSALVDDSALPLRDNSVDRLLVAHCLESTDRETPLLRELWRVLKPEGSLVIVVPNRRGIWAHIDTTPFGNGRPYSKSQIDRLLRQSLFTPTEWMSALHVPPFNRSMLLRSAMAWERTGSTLSPAFGGVLVVAARKEMVVPVSGKGARIRAIRDLVTIRREDVKNEQTQGRDRLCA